MKVLFIDRWAKVAVKDRWEPLSRLIPQPSTKSILLHFGSVYDDEFGENEKNYNRDYENLIIRDIHSYPTGEQDALAIVDQEQPDVAVFSAAINQPVYQAFVAACQYRQIPIGVMQYGVHPTDVPQMGEHSKKERRSIPFKTVKYNIWGLRYFFSSVRPIWGLFNSVQHTRRIFAAMVRYRQLFFSYPLPNLMLTPDFSLVFSETYAQHELKRANFEPEQILIVGNPFAPNREELNQYVKQNPLSENNNQQRQVLYIVQPLAEDRIVISNEWLLAHYKEIAQTLQQFDYGPIIFKLHPRSDETLYTALNELPRVSVEKNIDLNQEINNSCLVLGLFSTALVNAVMLGKSPIITSWVLHSNPDPMGYNQFDIFRVCPSLNALRELLRNDKLSEEQFNKSRQDFLMQYVGPAGGAQALANMIQAITAQTKGRNDNQTDKTQKFRPAGQHIFGGKLGDNQV